MTHPKNQLSALVTVFEDIETAQRAAQDLLESGFKNEQLELVTESVAEEAPQVLTPKVRQTTMSELVDGAEHWGAIGAGIGAIAGLIVPFPGSVLGMAAMGGVTGAIVGGMAGIEHAVDDDSVNLPSIKDYERLVEQGHKLLVVLGDHEQALKAERVIEKIPFLHHNTHVVEGHEFHEHPAKP